MTKPSLASQKKVTPENLVQLGAARLAQILSDVAETRTDLKRRLRMELAAGLGAVHLVPEIDKRLAAVETSRGQVTWRQKPAFLRDLDALRGLIADRLAADDTAAASARLWRFLATAPQTTGRLSARDEALDAIYRRAAQDQGRLLAGHDAHLAAQVLIEALGLQPRAWEPWLPGLLEPLSAQTAALALPLALDRSGAEAGWIPLVRHLADAAGDVETFRGTYGAAALATAPVAIAVSRRLMSAGRIAAAGEALRLAAPKPSGSRGRLAAPDFDWESAWIDYLEASGDTAAAQAVRWASYQRTLDVQRAKAFVARLSGFDDVEAEAAALADACTHQDFEKGLAVLMAWPALPEAAAMITGRPADVKLAPETAEMWAGKLRRRFPHAAHILLRKGAAAAFGQRAFKLSERLTEEADAMGL